MIELVPAESDVPEFLAKVELLIRGALAGVSCDRACVVKIDNWFGRKWLSYSGGGMWGWWNADLTLPPFVLNRVVSLTHYMRSAATGDFEITATGPVVHRKQSGTSNTHQQLWKTVPGVALFWYSGNSKPNARGSLMAYLPGPEEPTPWYVEMWQSKDWAACRTVHITPRMLGHLEEAPAGGPVLQLAERLSAKQVRPPAGAAGGPGRRRLR